MDTISERFHQLTAYRQDHIVRVTHVMEVLAATHGFDLEAARWAGFGHDLAREFGGPKLLAEARRLHLTIDSSAEKAPILLHGPIAAAWMQQWKIGDDSVWQAVRMHTTAGPELDILAKALFVADAVEPGRKYPERASLLELALDNLDAGYRAVLTETVRYNRQRNIAMHPDTALALAAEQLP